MADGAVYLRAREERATTEEVGSASRLTTMTMTLPTTLITDDVIWVGTTTRLVAGQSSKFREMMTHGAHPPKERENAYTDSKGEEIL